MFNGYGQRVGLAFQITDDLLDVAGDLSAVGKRVAKDANNGKLTFPSVLGIEESRRRAEELIDEACDIIEEQQRKSRGGYPIVQRIAMQLLKLICCGYSL
jgi:geranylgeranyl pyrophosphate synthase